MVDESEDGQELMVRNRPFEDSNIDDANYREIMNIMAQERGVQRMNEINEFLNIRQRNKVRIRTKVSKKDVTFRENFPKDRAE